MLFGFHQNDKYIIATGTQPMLLENYTRYRKKTCFYTQQWAGAEDGEGIRPAAGTGNE